MTEVRWKTVASHVLLAKKRPMAPDWKPRLPGSSCPALLSRSGVASLGPLPRTVLGTGGWPPQAPYEAPEGRSVALLRTRAHPHVTPFPLSQNGYVMYGGYGQRSQIVTVPPEPREPCYRSHGTRAPLTPRHVPPRAPLQPRRTPYSSYSQHGEPSHSKGGGEWCGVSQGETRGFRFALSRLYSTPRLVLRSTAAKPPERSKTRRERIAASAAVRDLCTCGPPGWSSPDQAPLTRRSRARCPSTRPLLRSDDDDPRYCPTTTTTHPLLCCTTTTPLLCCTNRDDSVTVRA